VNDWMLSQGTVDVRNEERAWRNGRTLQVPACDRCTLGVMDATNSHYLGTCTCECHESRATGPEDAHPREGAGS